MKRTGTCLAAGVLVLALGGATAARAQQRPLVTADPETIGAGQVLIETGFDWGSDQLFPASGLQGNLLRFPLIGVSVGLSSIAEVEIDGGPYNRLAIKSRRDAPLSHMVTATGDTSSSVDDIIVATKVRLAPEAEGRPSLGIRFATKLPNASNESGIGLDTTDFFASALLGKTVESVRFVGNIGLGILGDPTRGDRQNDVLTYGVSVARAMTDKVELVGEVNGRVSTRSGTPPPGTETRGAVRVGTRYTAGAVRFDGGVIIGTTVRDPAFGILGGFTYVFDAFRVP